MSMTAVHPSLLRRLVAATVPGLLVGFAFIAFFTSALHDPKPHDINVGVVGPRAVQAQVQQRLARALPGGFVVRRYASAGVAQQALGRQEVEGAFVPGSPSSRLLVAGAAGASETAVLEAAFSAAAATTGGHLAVRDVAPLPQHDAKGVSAFFLVAGTTLGSLVFGMVLFFAGGHARMTPLTLRLVLIAAFAALAGLVMAAADELVADGLGGAFWGVAGIVALLAAVVALVTSALVRWLGTPGVALSAAFLMLFSLPASGGAVGPEFVPGFYHAVEPGLPSHAALVALKGTVYFHGGGVIAPLVVLAAWAAAALLIQIAAHRLDVHPPAPPVTGPPAVAMGQGPAKGIRPSP